jgi:hypothetical protein
MTNWKGELYCGITLKWNFQAQTVDTSMPGYIAKALTKFCITTTPRPQHSPDTWIPPVYGAKIQYTMPNNTSTPLTPTERTRLQEIIGTLLYYGRAIDSTIPVALGTLTAAAQTNGTKETAQAVTQLLNYCVSRPDASVCYHASAMHLHIHRGASYLVSVAKARSRAGGIFFLSDTTTKNHLILCRYLCPSM